MKNLLFLTALLVSFNAMGQSDSEERPVRVCENMPKLAQCAGEDAVQADRCTQMTVMQLVADEITYPEDALAEGLEGTAYVSFIVEKDGSVNDVKIMRTPRGDSEAVHSLAAEAVRAVSTLPDFTPGTNEEGALVRVNFVTPVRYLLSQQ